MVFFILGVLSIIFVKVLTDSMLFAVIVPVLLMISYAFILKDHPDISDSPDVKFEEWAENIFFLFDMADKSVV